MTENNQHDLGPSIADGYHDAFGNWHATTNEVRDEILRAMRSHDNQRQAFDSRRSILVRAGESRQLPARAVITLEDGAVLNDMDKLPTDLPIGYHSVRFENVQLPQHLIVSPARCFPPSDPSTWGIAIQLYSVRSRASWGLGDFADLSSFAKLSARLGAGIIQVNPLGAVEPILPQTDSPYYPSSRRFLNSIYLRIEVIARSYGVDVHDIAVEAIELNDARLIDRDQVFRMKMVALERIWEKVTLGTEFEGYRVRRGESLACFAMFCSLSQKFGPDFRSWPERYRRPDSADVSNFQAENANAIRFFEWLQWLCEMQLADASRDCGLVFDLPIGFAPGGFDAWQWQDCVCSGMNIGSPPDSFNIEGQNWGIPPFNPFALCAKAFAPIVETVRSMMRNAVGLRIDHVMGLFRQFWIPQDSPAVFGTYVQFPSDELLAILAVESHRANCWIAGEDLGTVPVGMRERLADLDILSHRLALFERVPPREYPKKTLAAVTTHDLPTLAGLWSGADIESTRRIGLVADELEFSGMRSSVRNMADVDESAGIEEVIEKVYASLSTAPSLVRVANLEDALQVTERPNMPGTTDQWPNWKIALPTRLEEIADVPLLQRIAEHFSSGCRRSRAEEKH